MISTLLLFMGILFFALIIGFVFVYKYLREESIRRLFKKSSITMRVLLLLMIGYMISLPVQAVFLSRIEPFDLLHGATYYDDLILVDDGIIAVGNKSKSGPTITKHDFQGKEIWRTLYGKSREFPEFVDIEQQATGDLTVLLDTGSYKERERSILTYSPNGDLLEEREIGNTNGVKLIDGETYLTFEYDENKNDSNTPSVMVISRSNIEGEQLARLTYTYGPTEYSKFSYEDSVHLIGQTERHLFIKISTMRPWDYDVFEERLLVLDRDLTLVHEVKFVSNQEMKRLIQVEGSYFILSNIKSKRKSYLEEFDESFNLLHHYELNNDSTYFVMNDIISHHDHLYLIGNQYNNQRQVGFTDDYRGVTVDFDRETKEFIVHESRRGLGLQKVYVKEDSLYGVGRFNTHSFFLSNSYMHDNPSMGFLYSIELKDDHDATVLEILEDNDR